MMQDQMIESKFNAAVKVIRSLPKDGPYQPSHDLMLKFYGLYKQATEGPCKESKPSFYEVVKGYKWRAWTALGSMTKIEAMNTYVEELKKIVETMAYSDDVASFIEALGPFYEYVDIPGIKTSDDNHNITNKPGIESDSPDHGLFNGKSSPELNGDLGSPEKNAEMNIIPELVEVYMKTHKERMDRSSSNSPLLNGDTVIVNGIEDGDKLYPDVEIIEEKDIESSSFENGIKSTHLHALKKVISDTDSDDEYSEPAETPELLQQKQRQRRKLGEERSRNGTEGNSIKYVSENYNYDASDDSPVLEIVTCGGGDAADAGRIRFAHAHHAQQGQNGRQGESYSASMEQASTRQVVDSNGGRRRRRNSEDPRQSTNVDVNAQLIYILQKIHQDLEAVVVRLDSLETQALRQHQEVCALCRRRLGIPNPSKESSWWPFPELSPRSTFFLLTWPFVLHGAVKLLRFLRSRRVRKMAAAARVRAT